MNPNDDEDIRAKVTEMESRLQKIIDRYISEHSDRNLSEKEAVIELLRELGIEPGATVESANNWPRQGNELKVRITFTPVEPVECIEVVAVPADSKKKIRRKRRLS